MKSNKRFSTLCLIWMGLLLLSGCSSTRDLQRRLCANPVELGYEIISQPYRELPKAIVVLKEVGASNMDHRTWVKQKRQVIVPLLLYNYRGVQYQVTLGEQSLRQPYREFFVNALYAESDNSGCFRLEGELPEVMNDSVYLMEIYFDRIQTNGQLKSAESVALWFDEELNFGEGTLEVLRYTLKKVNSSVQAHVALYQGARCVFRKSYMLDRPYAGERHCGDVGQLCCYSMQTLGHSLSATTRELVENIVQEVNLIVNGRGNVPMPAIR